MKRHSYLFVSSLLVTSGTFAQTSINTSGMEATGTGGKVSASIGQPFFIEASNAEFSVQEGVQQVYLITPDHVEEVNAGIDLQVFPNPTNRNLSLNFRAGFNDDFYYQFLDLQGKILLSNKLTNVQTEIATEGFAAGTYMLRILQSEKSVQTFKIVKY